MSFGKYVSSRKNFYFRGTNELSLALKKRADLGLVKQVIKQNTSEMQEKAQRNAKFKGHYKGNKFISPTGNLKRNIKLSIKDGGLTGHVHSDADYSGYVEWGTRYMYAQPYMRPAYREQRRKFKQDMKRIMK